MQSEILKLQSGVRLHDGHLVRIPHGPCGMGEYRADDRRDKAPALFELEKNFVLLVKGFPLYRVSTNAKLTDGVSPSTNGYPCSLET